MISSSTSTLVLSGLCVTKLLISTRFEYLEMLNCIALFLHQKTPHVQWVIINYYKMYLFPLGFGGDMHLQRSAWASSSGLLAWKCDFLGNGFQVCFPARHDSHSWPFPLMGGKPVTNSFFPLKFQFYQSYHVQVLLATTNLNFFI